MTATPLRELLQEGQVVAGKYRISRVIGEGGMGCVVAARHLLLNQDVAVKFVLPSAASRPDHVARFFREAQAAAAIHSEHVVRVLDVGVLDDGTPYMVMEYLEGLDLASLVEQRGRLPVAEAAGYILEACEALAEAHAAGLVHRDIKPSNLFLTRRRDGTPLVKLLDFGIAKSVSPGDHALTSTGAVMGSPSYMSPEQIRGSKNVDPRADIWSLGATLHELVAASPPFVAEEIFALCVIIVTEPPARLSAQRPDLPPGLEDVVLRCLEKDPARRFQDVAALAQALAPFASPQQGASVDRVSRVLFSGQASAPEERGAQTSLAARAPLASATTAAPVSTTTSSKAFALRRGIRPALVIGAAFTIVGVAALAAAWLPRRGAEPAAAAIGTAARGKEAEPPQGLASAASSSSASASSLAPVSPAPVEAPAPTVRAEVSVATARPSASPGRERPRASPPASPRTTGSEPHVDPFADQH